jgi:uncharacterized coiled-coil protein SlyX
MEALNSKLHNFHKKTIENQNEIIKEQQIKVCELMEDQVDYVYKLQNRQLENQVCI